MIALHQKSRRAFSWASARRREVWTPERDDLRDWRDERDWRHPWRDPPGLGVWGGWGKGCGCCATSSSIPTIPSCCPGGFPTVVHVTFSNTGLCAAFDGLTFALTFSNTLPGHPLITTPGWYSSTLSCGNFTDRILFQCDTAGNCTARGQLQVVRAVSGIIDASFTLNSCTCSPLNFQFSINAAFACCGVAITATVTL